MIYAQSVVIQYTFSAIKLSHETNKTCEWDGWHTGSILAGLSLNSIYMYMITVTINE